MCNAVLGIEIRSAPFQVKKISSFNVLLSCLQTYSFCGQLAFFVNNSNDMVEKLLVIHPAVPKKVELRLLNRTCLVISVRLWNFKDGGS